MKIYLLPFILCIAFFVLPLCAGAKAKKPDGVSLQLTPAQLDVIGSGLRLTLTDAQRELVQTKLGKLVFEVWIIYEEPEGEVAELGYNLALRDGSDSILVLRNFAMNPEEAKKKHAFNQQMIGTPEKPSKENASFFIDAQGRIWQFMQPDEFTAYVKAHHGTFGYVDIQTKPPEGSSSLAYRDKRRFMLSQLRSAGAIVAP